MTECPSPHFRGEREGPVAQRRESEVGGAATQRVIGPLTLPSPPAGGGEGYKHAKRLLRPREGNRDHREPLHRTSGANDTIFMNRRARNSRVTGPKMRVPMGSF